MYRPLPMIFLAMSVAVFLAPSVSVCGEMRSTRAWEPSACSRRTKELMSVPMPDWMALFMPSTRLPKSSLTTSTEIGRAHV